MNRASHYQISVDCQGLLDLRCKWPFTQQSVTAGQSAGNTLFIAQTSLEYSFSCCFLSSLSATHSREMSHLVPGFLSAEYGIFCPQKSFINLTYRPSKHGHSKDPRESHNSPTGPSCKSDSTPGGRSHPHTRHSTPGTPSSRNHCTSRTSASRDHPKGRTARSPS